MTDIHTHILPSLDDGAKNVPMAIELLERIARDGFNKVVFTPHYYFDGAIPDYRNDCFQSIELLKNDLERLGLKARVGSEVNISHSGIITPEIKELAIEGTPYILIELSHSPRADSSILKKIENIINYSNLIPIIAHVERYPVILADPSMAFRLKEHGCLLQLNSSSIFSSSTSRLSKALLKNNLIDFIASDVHNTETRPSTLKKALDFIKSNFGEELYKKLTTNSDKVFDGERITSGEYIKVKKFLKFYY